MARALAERTPATYGIATGAFVTERDTWPAAIARARDEGWRWLELTAMGDRLAGLLALLDRSPPRSTASTGCPSMPLRRQPPPRWTSSLRSSRSHSTSSSIPTSPRQEPSCARLGSRAVFENMDVTKRFGRDVDDLQDVLDRFPAAGFCLDVAHVWTNDRTLRLGHDLIDAFGGRLRQLHVSGIEPDGTHRPTTATDVALYEPLLERCPHVPWLLEAELVEDAA